MGAFFNLYSGSLAAFRIGLRLSEGGFSGRSLNGKFPYIQDEYLSSVITFHDFDVGS